MSGLFGSNQSSAPAAAPVVTPPAVMPDTNSAAAIEARRRAQLDVMGRAGRTSTILTAPRDRGGDSYSSTTLGAGS
jgi:hypothetical protein